MRDATTFTQAGRYLTIAYAFVTPPDVTIKGIRGKSVQEFRLNNKPPGSLFFCLPLCLIVFCTNLVSSLDFPLLTAKVT